MFRSLYLLLALATLATLVIGWSDDWDDEDEDIYDGPGPVGSKGPWGWYHPGWGGWGPGCGWGRRRPWGANWW